jgi:hypothetical protein
MQRSTFAVAALIVGLAACNAGGADEPAGPDPAAEAAETGAVTNPAPTPKEAEEGSDLQSGEADDSACGADKLDRWLNVLPTDDVKAEIAATVGERPIRYYTQGDPITMDFSEARLNVELGEDGRIKLFRCG